MSVSLLQAKSAALRHLIWSLGLAGLLAPPALSVMLPVLRMRVSEPAWVSRLVFKTDVVATSQKRPERIELSESSPKVLLGAMNWHIPLWLAWAAGTVVSVMRMLLGWSLIERRRSEAKPFDELAVIEGVPVLENETGSMPMTYGVFRPVIFLPAEAKDWSAERRRLVLLHELAHVRRGDVAWQWVARAALSFYWWNPLAWFGWNQFLKERERAADDWVLNQGEGRSEYAEHLLEVARSMRVRTARWPVVAMASGSQLAGRLEAILDTKRERKRDTAGGGNGGCIGGMCLIAPLAAMQAQRAQLTVSKESDESAAVSSLITEGDQARDDGKPAAAKSIYTAALKQSPNSAVAYVRRGEVELALKDYISAMSDFTQAEAVDSSYASQAEMWMGITQQRQGNLEVADGFFQNSIAVGNPKADSTATVMELYSQLLEKQGKHDEAVGMQHKAREIRQPLSQAGSAFGPDVYRAGGDVTSPRLISKVEPAYSEGARIAGYSGTILLQMVIGKDGTPQAVRVIRGVGLGLDQKAVEAVNQWRFQPGTKGGVAVAIGANIEVNFRLR